MRNLNIELWVIIGLMLVSSNLNASDLASADPTSIELHHEKLDFHVKVSKVMIENKGELSEILVRFKDKSYSVPKEDLAGFGGLIDLEGIRLEGRVQSSGDGIESSGLKSFAICISYGKLTVNRVGEYELRSRDEVKFIFWDGELEERIRSETMGDGKSLWQTFSKQPGQEEIKWDIVKGIKNPYGAEIVEN